jgi:hypothetical protein
MMMRRRTTRIRIRIRRKKIMEFALVFFIHWYWRASRASRALSLVFGLFQFDLKSVDTVWRYNSMVQPMEEPQPRQVPADQKGKTTWIYCISLKMSGNTRKIPWLSTFPLLELHRIAINSGCFWVLHPFLNPTGWCNQATYHKQKLWTSHGEVMPQMDERQATPRVPIPLKY